MKNLAIQPDIWNTKHMETATRTHTINFDFDTNFHGDKPWQALSVYANGVSTYTDTLTGKTGLSIHNATLEEYEAIDAPEQEREGTRWKCYRVGSATITVFRPSEVTA